MTGATRVVRRSDAEWPDILDGAAALGQPDRVFVRGRRLDIRSPKSIAIVGSRRPTAAGLATARSFARGFAEAGFAVVSGLALGIDAAAHGAALDAGGYTVAVLGNGVDVSYPPRNARLQEEIAERGSLVSEYPDGTESRPHHFPERNRIIAGLAEAVLVVEGGLKSGALITARLADHTGRDVYAVPGSIRNPMAAGPNELIRTCGARLVTEIEHIISDLAPALVWDGPVDLGPGPRELGLEEFETHVLGSLSDVPISVDRLCQELGARPGAVTLALARLEIRGLAQKRLTGYELTAAGGRVVVAFPCSPGSL
ncbi:MAG: DNA-processing protein DprA [Actinomycetota bacterium]|nr:DNA-processing protein DprA [Actinomycetota bacterium]